MDAFLKQRCNLTHESGQEWRGEGIRRIQGRYETQGELLTLVDFDLLGTPIHDPILQHTAARGGPPTALPQCTPEGTVAQ